MSQFEGLKVIYEGAVVQLILGRPQQLNALNDNIRQVIAVTLNELMEQPFVYSSALSLR